MSSRSSSSVSKPASAARSSSTAGSSLALTSLTVTANSAARPGEVRRAVVVREGDGDRALLPRRGALQLVLEARHEALGAELDHLVAPLAAGERLAVERSEVVHDHEVAALGRPVHGLQAAGALAQALDLGVHGLVVGGGLAAADLQPLVLAERRLGPDPDLDRELQRLALAGKVAQVEVGLPHGHDRGRVDRGAVPGADEVAHGLVEHGLAADALDHDGGGRLAGAEAGNAEGAAELARGRGDALLDLLGGHLGLDAHARLGQLGDGGGDGNGHGGPQRYRRAMRERIAGWLLCGPLGHAWAGVADVAAALLAARREARARRRAYR